MTDKRLTPINTHCRNYIILRDLEDEFENIGEMIAEAQSKMDGHDSGDEDPKAWSDVS